MEVVEDVVVKEAFNQNENWLFDIGNISHEKLKSMIFVLSGRFLNVKLKILITLMPLSN